MLIRSQDKLKLIELDNIRIEINTYMTYGENRHSYYNVECNLGALGKYSTKEKAQKVLDIIEERYLDANDDYVHNIVFHMPEDSEVDV